MNEKNKKDVLREKDDEAITRAKTLLREARFAALATLDPDTGHPIASRVTIANEMDGTPIILISDLSSHTLALKADARCSLLIGEPAKGDPLAHPRMTLTCHAEILERDNEARAFARNRFLNRHPKATLYADFGDFHFFRLKPTKISLNAGFGKAYALEDRDILTDATLPLNDFKLAEQSVLEHMNNDHQQAINTYAEKLTKKEEKGWHLSGIDVEGMDLTKGDSILRFWFDAPLQSVNDIRSKLVALTRA